MKVYSKNHEWVLVEGDLATVGITNYAISKFGEIEYVELPYTRTIINKEQSVAFIDSDIVEKEVYSPLTGMVMEVNDDLDEEPELVNQGAESVGWLYKIKMTNPEELDELLSEEAYAEFTAPKE